MNDNEIVMNLLDFYKRKGIDLYKVLDDPTFKSLGRDTQLKALQMYANHILAGTPQGFSKNDFRSVLKNTLMQAGIGAVSGGATAFGLSKAFRGGSVPAEALLAGGIFGGMSGAFSGILGAVGRANDRRFMRSELETLTNTPTPGHALNVLTANHIRAGQLEPTNKVLEAVREKVRTSVDASRDEQVKFFVEQHNLDNERM